MSFSEIQRYLKKHGVTTDGDKQVIGLMSESGKIVPFQGSTVFDSQTVPTGVTGALFHHALDPKTIRVLQAPLKVVEVFGGSEYIVPKWSTDYWIKSITENIGKSEDYSDYSDSINADVNRTYQNREGYRHQVIVGYGELEVAKASAENFNIISEKRSSAMRTLQIKNNDIAFNGIKGKNLFGVLNDPELKPATAAAKTWNTATYEEIKTDIFAMMNRIIASSSGMVSLSDDFTLTIASTTETALASSENQYGKTLLARLKEAFPKLTINSLPQFDITTGKLAELRCTTHVEDVWQFGFGQKLKMHRIDEKTSSTIQKMSSQTFGARILYPMFVDRISGV